MTTARKGVFKRKSSAVAARGLSVRYVQHSKTENRFYILGHTDSGRVLFLVFTVRKNKLRVISARDMNKKERRVYQTHEEEDSPI